MEMSLLPPLNTLPEGRAVTGDMSSTTPCADQYNLDAVAEYKNSFEEATVLSSKQDAVCATLDASVPAH